MAITKVLYLDTAIKQGVVPLLKEASTAFDIPFPGEQVHTLMTGKPPRPFWWVYPGASSSIRRAGDQGTETYIVYARLVLGLLTERYEGKWAEQLWMFLPTFRHFFEEHRDLRIAPNQTKLVKDAALGEFSPFGVFEDGTEHVGLEAPITLTILTSYTPRI